MASGGTSDENTSSLNNRRMTGMEGSQNPESNDDLPTTQLISALQSPLQTWKMLDKVKFKSMELISMVNMDVARNGDNPSLARLNSYIQKSLNLLCTFEESLTTILVSPEVNPKLGLESLRNLGNGLSDDPDDLSLYGAHGGLDGSTTIPTSQSKSTRSGLPYLEQSLHNYIRRIEEVVAWVETQLESSSRVQESRYASTVLQAHGLRPSVMEFIITNLYQGRGSLHSVLNWIQERNSRLQMESKTFQQLMARDNGNSSLYMNAVQHENHRVLEELRSIKTAERIVRYLIMLKSQQQNKLLPYSPNDSHYNVRASATPQSNIVTESNPAGENIFSNEWEIFARNLTRIYTLLNTDFGLLNQIKTFRPELIEDRKTWADFQRNSSRELRIDSTFDGNAVHSRTNDESLPQPQNCRPYLHDADTTLPEASPTPGLGIRRRQVWTVPSPILPPRFADKQFDILSRGNATANESSGFVPYLNDHHHHQQHLQIERRMMDSCGDTANRTECQQIPSRRDNNQVHSQDRHSRHGPSCSTQQQQQQQQHASCCVNEHPRSQRYTSTAPLHRYHLPHHAMHSSVGVFSDNNPTPLMNQLLQEIRSLKQSVNGYEQCFRTIIDTLRTQQQSLSDLRRMVGSGNRDIVELDDHVDYLRHLLQCHQNPRDGHFSSSGGGGGGQGSRTMLDDLYRNLDDMSDGRFNYFNSEDISLFPNTNEINISPRPPSYDEVVGVGEPVEVVTTSEPIMINLRRTAEPRETLDLDLNNRERNSEELRERSGSNFTLNNQVAPGTRANNYWDNFKSYSQQNMLSTSKMNRGGGTSPSGSESLFAQSAEEVMPLTAASIVSSRRSSRGERGGGNKTVLSANFVENIGIKKRNKDLKQQQTTTGSPCRSNSSNSIPSHELNNGFLFNFEEASTSGISSGGSTSVRCSRIQENSSERIYRIGRSEAESEVQRDPLGLNNVNANMGSIRSRPSSLENDLFPLEINSQEQEPILQNGTKQGNDMQNSIEGSFTIFGGEIIDEPCLLPLPDCEASSDASRLAEGLLNLSLRKDDRSESDENNLD